MAIEFQQFRSRFLPSRRVRRTFREPSPPRAPAYARRQAVPAESNRTIVSPLRPVAGSGRCRPDAWPDPESVQYGRTQSRANPLWPPRWLDAARVWRAPAAMPPARWPEIRLQAKPVATTTALPQTPDPPDAPAPRRFADSNPVRAAAAVHGECGCAQSAAPDWSRPRAIQFRAIADTLPLARA